MAESRISKIREGLRETTLEADLRKFFSSRQDSNKEEVKKLETDVRKLTARQLESNEEVRRLKERCRTLEEAVIERNDAVGKLNRVIQERDDARKDASHHCLKEKELRANLPQVENMFREGYTFVLSLQKSPTTNQENSSRTG